MNNFSPHALGCWNSVITAKWGDIKTKFKLTTPLHRAALFKIISCFKYTKRIVIFIFDEFVLILLM